MIPWKKTMVVCPEKHTKNSCSICLFYIIMNYQQMTDSKNRDQVANEINTSITERALKEQVAQLQKECENNKATLRGYKDYVGKIFANDPTQVKLIALSQAIVEHLIPIDSFKAQTDDAYRHEMLVYRWHLAMSIEAFCNDYLEKLRDKKFRNEVLWEMHESGDNKK